MSTKESSGSIGGGAGMGHRAATDGAFLTDGFTPSFSYFVSEGDVTSGSGSKGGGGGVGGGPGMLVTEPSSSGGLMSVHQRRAQFRVNSALRKAEQSMLQVVADAAGNAVADQISHMMREPAVSTSTVALAITEALIISFPPEQQQQQQQPELGTPKRPPKSDHDISVVSSSSPERHPPESVVGDSSFLDETGRTTSGGANSLSLRTGPLSGADQAFMDQIRALAAQHHSPAHSPVPSSLPAPGSPGPHAPGAAAINSAPLPPFQHHASSASVPAAGTISNLDAIPKLIATLLPLFRPTMATSESAPGSGSSASNTASGLPQFTAPHPPQQPHPTSGNRFGVISTTGGNNNNSSGGATSFPPHPSTTSGQTPHVTASGMTSASNSNVGTLGRSRSNVTGGAGGMIGPSVSGLGLQSSFPSSASLMIHGGLNNSANSAMHSIYSKPAQQQQGGGGANAMISAMIAQRTDASMGMSMYSVADSMRSVARAPVSHTTNVIDTVDTVGMRYVNTYMILESCGAGSQGEVFCALDTRTNEYRAIKVMRRPMPQALLTGGTGTMAARAIKEAAETAQQLATEVKILSRCRHPSVIQLFDFIDDPAREEVFLVMQYVEHGALLRCDGEGNSSRTFPIDIFLSYARQVISGLAYLHKRGIAHRDIRGENVLVGALDRVVLADFGVSDMWMAQNVAGSSSSAAASGGAQSVASGDSQQHESSLLATTEKLLETLQKRIAAVYGTGRRCGTTAFLAPELLGEGDSNVGSPAPLSKVNSSSNFDPSSTAAPDSSALQAADVWALGLLFHLMLYGKLPFSCANAADYIENIVNSAFELPRTTSVVGREGEAEVVPRSIRIILSRMLHRDPAFRANIFDIRSAFKEVIRQREEKHSPASLANTANQVITLAKYAESASGDDMMKNTENRNINLSGDSESSSQSPGPPPGERLAAATKRGHRATLLPSEEVLSGGGGGGGGGRTDAIGE